MVIGFKRGIIAEILTLAGLIVAIFMAIFWYDDLSVFLIRQLKWNQSLSNVLSFILIFIAVIILFRLLENLLSHLTVLLLLNWINNLGGALFGFVRGSIIVGLLLFLLNYTPLPDEIEMQIGQSLLARFFLDGIIFCYHSIQEWLPENFQFEIDFLKERFYPHNNI